MQGTTYFNWREWIASLLALWTVHVPPEWLFGGQIAHGFFYPLFSSYPESEKPIGTAFSRPLHPEKSN